jgi:hypothetical protein
VTLGRLVHFPGLDYISGCHVVLRPSRAPDLALVQDTSTNGTFLYSYPNGRRVRLVKGEVRAVREGDVLAFGRPVEAGLQASVVYRVRAPPMTDSQLDIDPAGLLPSAPPGSARMTLRALLDTRPSLPPGDRVGALEEADSAVPVGRAIIDAISRAVLGGAYLSPGASDHFSLGSFVVDITAPSKPIVVIEGGLPAWPAERLFDLAKRAVVSLLLRGSALDLPVEQLAAQLAAGFWPEAADFALTAFLPLVPLAEQLDAVLLTHPHLLTHDQIIDLLRKSGEAFKDMPAPAPPDPPLGQALWSVFPDSILSRIDVDKLPAPITRARPESKNQPITLMALTRRIRNMLVHVKEIHRAGRGRQSWVLDDMDERDRADVLLMFGDPRVGGFPTEDGVFRFFTGRRKPSFEEAPIHEPIVVTLNKFNRTLWPAG